MVFYSLESESPFIRTSSHFEFSNMNSKMKRIIQIWNFQHKTLKQGNNRVNSSNTSVLSAQNPTPHKSTHPHSPSFPNFKLTGSSTPFAFAFISFNKITHIIKQLGKWTDYIIQSLSKTRCFVSLWKTLLDDRRPLLVEFFSPGENGFQRIPFIQNTNSLKRIVNFLVKSYKITSRIRFFRIKSHKKTPR